MLSVLTIDQRRSRREARNRASDLAERLNHDHWDQLIRPFTLTVGDEIQGVTDTPQAIVEIMLGGIRDGRWWVGLGIGRVETPLMQTAARSRGPAFYNARDAVEAAKKSRYGFAVRAEETRIGGDIETILELLAFVIRRRGQDPKRWQAVEMALAGASTVEIGRALGITQQAASKRLLNAGVDEEMGGRLLVERMLATAMERGDD
ncbi:MAG: SatD family protein [Solirubrobacterales bacterium]